MQINFNKLDSNKRNEIECPNGLKVVWQDFEAFPDYDMLADFLRERVTVHIDDFSTGFRPYEGTFLKLPMDKISLNPLAQILIDFRKNIVNEYKEKYEALLKEKAEKEKPNYITW